MSTAGRTARREFLIWSGAMAAGALSATSLFAQGQPSGERRAKIKTRLILLGTGGGPRPRKNSLSSSQVILVNDVPYVVDCGYGVARQLVFAGIPLARLRHVFIPITIPTTTPSTAPCSCSPGPAGCGPGWTPGGRRRSRRSPASPSR